MTGSIRNYYAGGNTARGFHSLFESNLKDLDRVFILKGGPGTGKSSLMNSIGSEWSEKGYDVEFIHCSSDNGSIDGVIVKELKIGIVDGTAPHVIEPKAPGAIEEYINLGSAWDSHQLEQNKHDIIKYTGQISEAFETAYATFAEALAIHDEWEDIYIENMDFNKADILTDGLINTFIGDNALNKVASVQHRFLGAATPIGAVDFVENLTDDVSKRYLIKGRPGSGKSTLLKKLAKAAEKNGFDTEVYHCGFDPNSLDMVIVRELNFAIFDSTAPHEYFPDRETDEVIDMYDILITPGTDEKFSAEIKNISQRYSTKMKEATAFLAKAKSLHDDLEQYYIEAMDFSKVESMRESINSEIERIAHTAAPR